MMRDFGITYRSAAENIAKGQQTSYSVVPAWMNSSGHRANILNEN
ncbi:transporter [Gracilibacillus boraciitolerans JCM 21714]|uniref:Transporter n=1 Tax=Gracilibacillus boraciitolerans JCM 21714 TaxID=1298598 RepID=W4VDK5_9BACI|nr:transporter [Gracilibacillus boraciitolerans JCM 21714]